MAKFCKLSFNLSASHAKNEFELLHVDISDPYRVQTTNKHKYLLTIVDDTTQLGCISCNWGLILMMLCTFIIFVTNQFKKQVKVITNKIINWSLMITYVKDCMLKWGLFIKPLVWINHNKMEKQKGNTGTCWRWVGLWDYK